MRTIGGFAADSKESCSILSKTPFVVHFVSLVPFVVLTIRSRFLMAKLILGCGYLGLRVARRWLAAGEVVHAVTRSPERANALKQQGLKPIVADVADPSSIAGDLPEAETVLYAIGFDAKAGKSRRKSSSTG